METKSTQQGTCNFKRCLLPWLPNGLVTKSAAPTKATDTYWNGVSEATTDGFFWGAMPTWTITTPIFSAPPDKASEFAQRILAAKKAVTSDKSCYRVMCNWVFFPSTDGIAGVDLTLRWVHPKLLGISVVAPPLPADTYAVTVRLSIAWIVFHLTLPKATAILQQAQAQLAELSRLPADKLAVKTEAKTASYFMDTIAGNTFPGETWWKFKHSLLPAPSVS
jgi:hypothetical protein